jgi:hypothetical protein
MRSGLTGGLDLSTGSIASAGCAETITATVAHTTHRDSEPILLSPLADDTRFTPILGGGAASTARIVWPGMFPRAIRTSNKLQRARPLALERDQGRREEMLILGY